MSGKRPLLLRHGSLSFGLALLLAGILWYGLGEPTLLGSWLMGVNLATVGYFGWDKWQARRNGGRVPELILYGLALAGGSLGAVAAMRLFRHKTLQGRFRLLLALIVLLQIGLLVVLNHKWFFG